MRLIGKILAWLILTAIIGAIVGFITILGFGALGVPITIIASPIISTFMLLKLRQESDQERQMQESHVLQKMAAGVPLTDKEKGIHAEMIAQASPHTNNQEREDAE